MTNKTNGIDVSDCKYFNKVVNEEPYCNIDEEHLYTCSSDENCYYKQLKRLQHEFDIKEKMLDKFMIGSGEILEKLQEENEKLKEKIKDLDAMTGIFSVRLANKYKQALEEIREMILGFGNTPIEFKTLNIPLKEEDLKTNEGKFFDFYTKLKDKINEVLNDRN